MSSVADVVAATLARSGTRIAFGHPGGELAVLIDALARHGIRFFLTHHETTAAFMAGGQGELSGRPGVCLATLGPGATNMTTGVANALLDRAPLIAITASLAVRSAAGTTHQRLDLNALYRPITKASWALDRMSSGPTVAAALALSTAVRPGPVHLSLASDVARAPAAAEAELSSVMKPLPDGSRPLAGREVDRARRLIAESHRPVIVAGLDAVHAGGSRALVRAARALGAGVVVTPKAKGLIAEGDPLFLGVLEMAGDDLIIESLRGIDLAITVGLDAVELDKPWRLSAPVIAVTSERENEPYVAPTIELSGSIPDILSAITPARRRRWASDEVAKARADLRAYLCPEARRLQPWQVVDIARRAFPLNTVAASDVGAHKFLVGQLWRTERPRSFLQSNGLSAMGYGLPVAAAARLLDPRRSAVALIGDGGLAMYLGELETLKREALDVTVIVFADGSLELIRRSQLRQAVATDGTAFDNPDFLALARAFGIHGHVAETPREMERAAQTAAGTPGVHLIAARISAGDYRL